MSDPQAGLDQPGDEMTDLLVALRRSVEAAQLDIEGNEHPVTEPKPRRRPTHRVTIDRLQKLWDHPKATYSERQAITHVCGFLEALLDGRAAERTESDLMF